MSFESWLYSLIEKIEILLQRVLFRFPGWISDFTAGFQDKLLEGRDITMKSFGKKEESSGTITFFKTTILLLACFFVFASVSLADWDTKSSAGTGNEIEETLEKMRAEYPVIDDYLKAAYAYAVFPKIKKAGLGIGGAQGHGSVFKDGKAIGKARVRQLTVGFQGGLQAYCELIFFKDEETFAKFKAGKTELNAQASAVVMQKGMAGKTTYSDGLAVFTLTLKGLMYEATIGGQRLKYEPLEP